MTKPLPGFERLRILDSSAAINFKKVPVDKQWDLGERLHVLVDHGMLKFPVQVRRELTDPEIIQHPDMPGAWAARAWQMMGPKPAPKAMTVKEVLASHPELVDEDARFDQADAYVAALALECARDGYDVIVIVDADSLRDACDSFGIPTMSSAELVELVLRA